MMARGEREGTHGGRGVWGGGDVLLIATNDFLLRYNRIQEESSYPIQNDIRIYSALFQKLVTTNHCDKGQRYCHLWKKH